MTQTTQLEHCLNLWGCSIINQVNWDATGNSQEIDEYVDGDVKIRLHRRGALYFIEERIGKAMYPKIYRVTYMPPPSAIGVTDAEYEQWLRDKSNAVS